MGNEMSVENKKLSEITAGVDRPVRVLLLDRSHQSLTQLQGELSAIDSVTWEPVRTLDQLRKQDSESTVTWDVLLLNLDAFGADGIEFCRKVETSSELARLPVILITTDPDSNRLSEALGAGGHDFLSRPVDPIELRARLNSAYRYRSEVIRHHQQVKKLKENQEKLHEFARRDGLTGLYNRRILDQVLLREWKRSARNREPLGFIMIDIDQFKLFNDEFGHLEGDRCLSEVAGILEDSLLRDWDLAARYGGDEFVVLLPETDSEGVETVAERVREGVEQLRLNQAPGADHDVITVSVGISCGVGDPDESPDDLIARADDSMYRAKVDGGNTLRSV